MSRSVYIRAIDENDGNGRAWICVDDFVVPVAAAVSPKEKLATTWAKIKSK